MGGHDVEVVLGHQPIRVVPGGIGDVLELQIGALGEEGGLGPGRVNRTPPTANRACMAAWNAGAVGDGRASVWGRDPTSTVVVVGARVVVVVGATVVVVLGGRTDWSSVDGAGPPQATTRRPASHHRHGGAGGTTPVATGVRPAHAGHGPARLRDARRSVGQRTPADRPGLPPDGAGGVDSDV